MIETFPRGDNESSHPDHDTSDIADNLSEHLETNGEGVQLQAQDRIDKASHTLDAIEGFSDQPAEEIENMVAAAKETGKQEPLADADRVAGLAIAEGQDKEDVISHELNGQLDAKNPAVVDALTDLVATNPDKAQKVTAALDAEIYFHGSNYTLEIGDEITPGDGAILGKDGIRNASATTHEQTAWSYAVSKENLPTGARDYEKGVNRRARVYEVVTSNGKPAERLGPQKGEVNSPSFRVVGYRDVAPGRQGTIPEVNWKEYSPYVDANHITENPLVGWEGHDYKDTYQPSPNDIPLPGLGDDYVRAEEERTRKDSGLPIM